MKVENKIYGLIMGSCEQLRPVIKQLVVDELKELFSQNKALASIKFIGNGLWLFDINGEELEFIGQKHFSKNKTVAKIQELRYIPIIGDLLPLEVTLSDFDLPNKI